jgi:NAD(P)-dependent dehydrogenase (short-subunit alcohol dehydrogenase family)
MLCTLRSAQTNDFLRDKVVWVTGASSGLGEQLAIAAAAGGARAVVLSGRRADALQSVAEACQAASPPAARLTENDVLVLPFDLSDSAALEAATAKALKTFDRVNVLVNNAGVSTRAAAVDSTLQVDRQVSLRTLFCGSMS